MGPEARFFCLKSGAFLSTPHCPQVELIKSYWTFDKEVSSIKTPALNNLHV